MATRAPAARCTRATLATPTAATAGTGLLLATLLLLSSPAPALAQAQSTVYGFSPSWSTVGSASINWPTDSSNAIIGTTAELVDPSVPAAQSGAVWAPYCIGGGDFTVEFDLEVSYSYNGGFRFAGFAFVLQSDHQFTNAVGAQGLGGGWNGIQPAVALSLMAPAGDRPLTGTWMRSSPGSTEAVPVSSIYAPFTFGSVGTSVNARVTISYVGDGGILTASTTAGGGSSASTNIELYTAYGGRPFYFGFTASTSAAEGEPYSIRVKNFVITSGAVGSPCPRTIRMWSGLSTYSYLNGWNFLGGAMPGITNNGDIDRMTLTVPDRANQAAATWAPSCLTATTTFFATFTVTVLGSGQTYQAGPDSAWAFVLQADPRGRAALGLSSDGTGIGTGAYRADEIKPSLAFRVAAGGSTSPRGRGQYGSRGFGGGNFQEPFMLAPADETGSWDCAVNYDAVSQIMSVSVGGNSVSAPADLQGLFGSSPIVFGFTAGTGSNPNRLLGVTIESFTLLTSQPLGSCPGQTPPMPMPTPTPAPASYGQSVVEGLQGWRAVGTNNNWVDLSGSRAVLTGGGPAVSAGAVWAPFCVSLTADFTLSFTVRSRSGFTQTTPGEEGWALVLHADPSTTAPIGALGRGLGFAGLPMGRVLRVLDGGYSHHTAVWGVLSPGVADGYVAVSNEFLLGPMPTEQDLGSPSVTSDPVCCPNCCLDVTVRYDRGAARLTVETASGVHALEGVYLEQSYMGGSPSAFIGFTAGTMTSPNYPHDISNVRLAYTPASCPMLPPPGGGGGGGGGGGSTAVSIRWDLLLGFGKLLLTFLEQLWKAVTGQQGRGL